ncbi:protein FAM13A isoform X2 [Pangasianodon hypophthalmus]|uniref:protein FAM13A isoform X2 n=1 Tax=Pangasianodon hypophthalmus TaxID=310915 RepID=UPI0023075280|nr:protein FAM13A isoform X2 [Pangasianodon hypophthalmus]
MGAGALTICHNRTAVQIRIREDMKKMVQLPVLKNLPTPATAGDKRDSRVFGVSLMELSNLGLVKDGVPSVLRSMVEYLRQHGLQQEGLFRVSASVRAVESLKQRLDRGEEVDLEQEAEVCTVASLLKLYLRELPEGLVHSSIHNKLIQLHNKSNEDEFCKDMQELLLKLPDVHYSVLRYLCHFLTQVEQQQCHNRMTAFNLATVFGPNVFHVSSGFEGIQEQDVCNKIMARLIENYSTIFEPDGGQELPQTKPSNIIMVKEAHIDIVHTDTMSTSSPTPKAPSPLPRKKKATRSSPVEDKVPPTEQELSLETPVPTPRKKKVKRVKGEAVLRSIPQPAPSTSLPFSRHLSQASEHRAKPRLNTLGWSSPEESMDLNPPKLSPIGSMDTVSSSQDDERPISPFYVSSQLSPGHYRPDLAHYLEKTIRSAVEQHLFDAHMQPDQSLQQTSEAAGQSSFPATTARQRRRQQREQEENRERCRDDIDKENIPSRGLNSSASISISITEESERRLATADEDSRSRKPKQSPTLTELSHNQGSLSQHSSSKSHDRNMAESMGPTHNREAWKTNDSARPKTPAMKIQEAINGPEPSDGCEDVPRLDLSALMEDSNWGEPVPAYSSWHRDNMDSEEAHLSPHTGGKMIRQLLEEDSDPMLSPRFYAYGNSQQYLDDTEVPPSPPNTHSFISRRRSSSLGSCDNESEELTSTQLSKKIHNLKKKIRKFEEKFEEERKYRPSHSDKAANPEVLRWMNELAKLRKDLKEHSLLKSEEDLAPLPRQRSNTLPKSFGSQLEKKSSEAKTPKPPVESTLETVMNKLQEKRTEAGRPEDIKDMTREQIGAEKVALQKALLYYEGIHGRPITKTERQLMKPLYDRYRLVKQILCRASTIPVIGSPSSKRRGLQLQPIIEGEPALFFDHGKEEEDGSDEDNDNRTQFAQLTVRPELSMLGFLDHLDEEVDGFISPVDELSPSKNSTDMRLSNLHAATIQELVEQLQEAREEKKRIRKNLREFEDQFFRQNGRNVQKEDRSPLAVEYNEYKHIKAKLKLLEVLISKRDSSKFI